MQCSPADAKFSVTSLKDLFESLKGQSSHQIFKETHFYNQQTVFVVLQHVLC